MNRVHRVELPWTNIDALHRMVLNEFLVKYSITSLSEADKDYLNRIWHRLTAWPDAIPGLTRLGPHYVLATLSNDNVALFTNMAKYAGLPWDCMLSAELM
jgi:2-haloacid dehalogenase